jgi:hypothetical protein
MYWLSEVKNLFLSPKVLSYSYFIDCKGGKRKVLKRGKGKTVEIFNKQCFAGIYRKNKIQTKNPKN